MKNILITPEAIAEMVYEYWHNNNVDDDYSRQILILEQGALYYRGICEEIAKDTDSDLICDRLNDKEFNIIKQNGIYNKASILTYRNFIQMQEELVFPIKTAKYYQIKDCYVEEYIVEVIKKFLPVKILKKRKVLIQYQADLSTDWKYHERTSKNLLHIMLDSMSKVSGNPLVMQSCYNFIRR